MPRIPRAARQLHTEIASVVPDTTILPSEPDGFGVYRVVVYEGDGVSDILAALKDKRIKAISGNVVEFSSHVNADDTSPFGAAKAHAVLSDSSDTSDSDPEPTLEERLNSMTKAEIAEEYGFESGTKKDMIAEILSDAHED